MSFTSGLIRLLATAHELGQSKSEIVPNPKRLKLNNSISKPYIAPTSLDSLETKAMPVIEPEKMAALSAFAEYHKTVYPPNKEEQFYLIKDSMPGYPKPDPYNPGKLIHSYKIPPERRMSKEQRKLIDKKIQHPNLPRFKHELNKLADEMVETSFDIYDENGVELARRTMNHIPSDIAYNDWELFLIFHLLMSVGYSGGCAANLKHDISSMKFSLNSKTVLASAGLLGVREIKKVAAVNEKSTNTSTRAYYTSQDGNETSFTFARWLDFMTMSEDDKLKLQKQNRLPSFLHDYYISIAPEYLTKHGISQVDQDKIMERVRNFNCLAFGSALLNTNTSRMGMHTDAKSPLPTLLAGSTNYKYLPGIGLKKKQNGGLLFLADGLVPIPYSHRDTVLLNPEAFHGVSVLQTLPGTNQKKGEEMSRFSCVLSWRMDKQKNESWSQAIQRKPQLK